MKITHQMDEENGTCVYQLTLDVDGKSYECMASIEDCYGYPAISIDWIDQSDGFHDIHYMAIIKYLFNHWINR